MRYVDICLQPRSRKDIANLRKLIFLACSRQGWKESSEGFSQYSGAPAQCIVTSQPHLGQTPSYNAKLGCLGHSTSPHLLPFNIIKGQTGCGAAAHKYRCRRHIGRCRRHRGWCRRPQIPVPPPHWAMPPPQRGVPPPTNTGAAATRGNAAAHNFRGRHSKG